MTRNWYSKRGAHPSRMLVVLLAALLALGFGASGCSCGSDDEADRPSGTGASGGAGGGTGTGGSGGDILTGGNGQQQFTEIKISPEDPILQVDNGVLPPPIQFTAVGVTPGGTEVPLNGQWDYDRIDIGDVGEGTGEFSATGLAGGQGIITFTSGNDSGTTTASVKLYFSEDPENIDPGIKNEFPNASDPDPAMALLYPYDETVFPRGLTGPVVQWNGGAATDVYYLHATSPYFEYETWGTVPPPSRYSFPTAPTDIWLKLTDSTVGDIQIDIQRYDGNVAYLANTQTWTIAPANLAGTIYYWEVNTGNVVRIKPGDAAPENFIQKPPGTTCVACHSVSKDGSTIVASFHGGYSPWGTFNAADGSSIYAQNEASGFQAISPNGSHVIWRHWSGPGFPSTGYLSLSTVDSNAELAQLNPGVGAPSHPAWSTDGNQVAFSVRTDGNGLDFNNSTLWITDVDLQTPGFSNIVEIVQNDAARPTVTYPTFSPDSQWIAFERATQARSRDALGEIWLTNTDGSIQIPLDNTNGTGYLAGTQANATFEPTFNPVLLGGYFWLVVVSERTYGNTLTDTNPTTRRKQLWVTAIDANPVAGQDPSHPAFWLPGQGLDNNNMRGEWALSPCKQIGEECEAGFECCDGFCTEQPDGTKVCSNDSGGCSNTGEACDTAADCCDPGDECINGFCAAPVPQ